MHAQHAIRAANIARAAGGCARVCACRTTLLAKLSQTIDNKCIFIYGQTIDCPAAGSSVLDYGC